MKKIMIIILFLLLSSTTFYSQPPIEPSPKCTYEVIEANLLEGLKTDNCGLKISCAYYLGEMKSTRAVIPLMAMLRCEENENARLIAALSLIKIEDPRGVFLVKREAEFNDCERIRCKCGRFYKAFQYKKLTENNYSLIAASSLNIFS